MGLLKRRLHWVFVRAWPLWIGTILFVAHVPIGLWALGWDRSMVNPIVALATQILGIVLTILSIDATIARLKSTNLISELRRQIYGYLNAWPRKRTVVGSDFKIDLVAEIKVRSKLGRVELTSASLEERIARFDERIHELRERFESEIAKLGTDMEKFRNQHGEEISKINDTVGKVQTNFEAVIIGGLRPQFFGLFLFGYGALTNFLAG